MQIGVFYNDTWQPALLSTNDQGIIVKMENKVIIIAYSEVLRIVPDNDNTINIIYMERQNGEASRNQLIINSDNIEQTIELLAKKEVKVNEQYIPPEVNVFTKKEEVLPEISEENIIKQQDLNDKSIKPKKGIPIMILAPIIIIMFLFASYKLRLINLNSKENLILSSEQWTDQNESEDYFVYHFYEEGMCKIIHYQGKNSTNETCSYTVKGKKITLNFEEEKKQLEYNWKLNYEINIKEFKIDTVLYLNDEKFTSKPITR